MPASRNSDGLTPKRKPQPITVDQFFSPGLGLPEKTELVEGMIGPFEDAGIRTLIANWGVDRVIAATGPEIWREALSSSSPKPGRRRK